MKAYLAWVMLCLLKDTAFGQEGTVLFANRVTGVVDARVMNGAPFQQFSGPVDGRFYAQLYASAPGGTLLPVGDPVRFYEEPSAALGYFPPSERMIPGVAVGAAAQVKVVAWYRAFGETYEAALARGWGAVGESAVIMVSQTGGGIMPPALLEGLQGFQLGITLGFDPRPNTIVGSGFPLDVHGIRQSFDFYPTVEWVEGVAISGSTAYVASGYGGLRLFDIADPQGPRRLGYVLMEPTLARAVAVAGRYAYVTLANRGTPGSGMGLRVVDVADPSDPRLVSRIDLEGEPQDVVLTSDGRYAMVSAGPAGWYVVDIQDSTAPKVAGRYESGGHAKSFASVGELGFLACGTSGVHVLQLADVTHPRQVGLYSPGDEMVDVVARGTLMYVSGQETGLHVVDVSDPAQPRRIGLLAMVGGAGSALLLDRLVYVQNHGNGLSVVDISDPALPRVVGRTTSAKEAKNLALGEGRLWVADYVGLTGFPVGPRCGVGRDRTFEMTGLQGQPYEIQEPSSWEAPFAWSRLTEVIGTGERQVLNLPASTHPTGRLVRAVALP